MKLKRIVLLFFVLSLLLSSCTNNSVDYQSKKTTESTEINTETEVIDVPENDKYNIALGKKYELDCASFRTDKNGDSNDAEGKSLRYKLTDGKLASDGASSDLCIYNGKTVTISFDLGDNFVIDTISLDLFGTSKGIYNVENYSIDISASFDNERYFPYEAITFDGDTDTIIKINNVTKCIYTTKQSNVEARYLKIQITSVGNLVELSEIQITGSKPTVASEINGIPCIYIDNPSGALTRNDYVYCSITVLDPTTQFESFSDTNSQVKYRGNSSFAGDKKPYNIKFESKTNLLGLGSNKKWCLIPNLYDRTMLRNKLAYDTAIDLGFYGAQESKFVHVYFNNEYQGLYLLTEPVDASRSRLSLDSNNNEFLFEYEILSHLSSEYEIQTPIFGYYLAFDDSTIVSSNEQLDYLQNFFYKFESALLEKNYDIICEMIDINSFVDHYIICEYYKLIDFNVSSTRYYIKDNKLYAGPLWDFDLSSGNASSSYYKDYYVNGDSSQDFWCRKIWNEYLLGCDEFNQEVLDRMTKLKPFLENYYMENDYGISRIDQLLETYQVAIDYNNHYWDIKITNSILQSEPIDGTYEGEINYLKEWFKNRLDWLYENTFISE